MEIRDTLENLSNLLAEGKISETQVHDAYERTAREVPRGALAEGLSEAFRSDQTPPFEQMVTGLFRQSNPAQKAGLLNQILAALGAARAAQAIPIGWIRSFPGVLYGGRLTPEQASRVPAEEVEVLAAQAARRDPSIVDRAARFYSQHPLLVKAIGAGALALIVSRLPRATR